MAHDKALFVTNQPTNQSIINATHKYTYVSYSIGSLQSPYVIPTNYNYS